MLRNIILSACLVFASAIGHANAGASPYTCEVYEGTEVHLPQTMKSLLALEPGAAAKLCAAPTLPDRYYLLSVVQRTRLGSCEFTETRTFPAKTSTGWTFTPPEGEEYFGRPTVYILPEIDRCPPREDHRYISLNGASEVSLLRFVHFLRAVRSSEAEFHSSFAQIPAETAHSTTYEQFEAAFLRRDSTAGPPSLKAFIPLAGAVKKGTQRYMAIVEDGRSSWGITFDLVGESVRIRDVGSVVE